MLLLPLPLACGEARHTRRLFAPTLISLTDPWLHSGLGVHVSHCFQTPVPCMLGRQRVNASSGHCSPLEDVNLPARAGAVASFP